MPPTIAVSDPGTVSEEFVPSEAQPSIKFFTKRWTPTASPPKAGVLFIHGFLENIERYDHVFPVFASKGISVLAFDQRGFGRTAKDGTSNWKKEHSNTTRVLQYQDIAQMLRAEKKHLDDKYGKDTVPLFVVGHSMGGGLALATFTRPESEPYFPKETLASVKGVVALAPWLLLVDNPSSFVVTAAGLLTSVLPSAKRKAPLNPKHTARDEMVQKEYLENPFTNPNVYLKAIHGPLSSGLNILNREYVNFPEDLPLLIVHGTADSICAYKGSKDIHEKIKAKDKKLITMEGYYHEMHNEPGQDKEIVINHVVDWILERATPASTAAASTAPLAAAVSTVPAKKAWATLLTGEKYLPGLLVFSRSLLRGPHASKYPLVVMVTPDVSEEAREVMREMGCVIRPVDEIKPTQEGATLAYERFGLVWTKLRAFELAEYERVILIDSDMLVRRNMDELMDWKLNDPEGIGASFACSCNPRKVSTYPASWIPENCPFTPQQHPEALTKPTEVKADSKENYHLLNSGLVILKPSKAIMDEMVHQIATDPEVPEMRFPDQDFLAKYYKGRFTPLPWCYNALKPLRQCHSPLWRDEEVRNVHYILDKPWNTGHPASEDVDKDAVTHGWWWQAYEDAKKERSGLLADDAKWTKYIAGFVNDAPREEPK